MTSVTANAAHLLDDFLETIETIPTEVKSKLELLAQKDSQYEESRKSLFKKRNLYLRAEEKGLDLSLQSALLRKTEREHQKLLTIIDEKISLEGQLYQIIEQHLQRLEQEMLGKLGMNCEIPYKDVFRDIPEAEQRIDKFMGNNKSRQSPKKRQNLADEPIDPNEPVYCYCKQVSYGDMIACDNPICSTEWFHYHCVGLSAPPQGKWYCKDCSSNKTLS